MWELKSLSKDAIPEALSKVERYRLLNEPEEAESICLDILAIDPENQEALIMLLLARTDQFPTRMIANEARELLDKLHGEYERAYYAGIICERQARAYLRQAHNGSDFPAYDFFHQAMAWYEKAEALRPPGNDDAILRWNTCARFLMQNQHLRYRAEDHAEPVLSD